MAKVVEIAFANILKISAVIQVERRVIFQDFERGGKPAIRANFDR